MLSNFFGVVALLLSAIGLYGMLSSNVSQRTGEIGIRVALGASRGTILRMVFSDAFRLVAIGAVLGAVALFFTTRSDRAYALRRLGVRSRDARRLLPPADARRRSWPPTRRPGARRRSIRCRRCAASSDAGSSARGRHTGHDITLAHDGRGARLRRVRTSITLTRRADATLAARRLRATCPPRRRRATRTFDALGARIDPHVAKPRLIVLTDIANEPDDQMSLVRLLVYSNQFDIEGLVATTSRHLRKGPRPDVIRTVIDAYAKVQPNLLKHEPGFPEAVGAEQAGRRGSGWLRDGVGRRGQDDGRRGADRAGGGVERSAAGVGDGVGRREHARAGAVVRARDASGSGCRAHRVEAARLHHLRSG